MKVQNIKTHLYCITPTITPIFATQNHALLLDFLCFGRRSGSRCPFLFEKTMIERINLRDVRVSGLGDVVEYTLRYINPVGETIYKNFTNFDALLTDVYAAIGFSYDKSVAIVHDRVNWNRCKAYNGSDYTCSYNKNFKQWDIDGFLPFAKVKNIINAYTNQSLRKENPLPEYVPASATAPAIIKQVAQAAAVKESEAKEVLSGGYYAYKSGELPDDFIVFPQQYQKNKDLRKTNDDAPSGGNTLENIGSGLGEIGTYLLIGGVVLAGLYALTLLKK